MNSKSWLSVFSSVALCTGFAVASSSLGATPLSDASHAELNALFATMQSSGCEFNRNGTWYNAQEAKQHLLKKLGYLEDKNMVKTTEQFIEKGASGSSMSGKPYMVRCPNMPEQKSAVWLNEQLQKIRKK